MQVLLFVFAILMTMSLMTYQRIAAFLDLSALRQEYACYMEITEHIDFNETQKAQYKAHQGKSDSKPASDRIDGVRYINLNTIFTKGDKEKVFETQYLLLNNLIEILYSRQPFYQKILEERPRFVDEMIQAMIREAKNFQPKIEESSTLANFNLHDAALQSVYVKMLNGHQEDQTGQCGPGLVDNNYDSLLKYVGIKTKEPPPPIRVQLAPKNLLLAIFQDPVLVDEIIQERDRLRRMVTQNKDKKNDAKVEFERFKDRIPRGLDGAQFNFQITSTAE